MLMVAVQVAVGDIQLVVPLEDVLDVPRFLDFNHQDVVADFLLLLVRHDVEVLLVSGAVLDGLDLLHVVEVNLN